MARARKRVQECTAADARARLGHARDFLDVAELTADETDPTMEYAGVAASLAVLAGIAASDAACCAALGRRSRSENHHDAEELLATVLPGGKDGANRLRRLIGLKDSAQYGLIAISSAELKRSLRDARELVDLAELVLTQAFGESA